MKSEDIKVNTINVYANEVEKVKFSELVDEKDMLIALKETIASLRDESACKKYYSKVKFGDKQKLGFGLNYIYTKGYFEFIKTTNDSTGAIGDDQTKEIIEIAYLVTYISIDKLFESEQNVDPLFGIAMGIIFHVAYQIFWAIKLEKPDFEVFRRLIVANAIMYMYKSVYKLIIVNPETPEDEKESFVSTIPMYVETVVGESADGIINYFSIIDKNERQNIFNDYKKKLKFVNYKHFTKNWWRLAIDMRIDYLGDMIANFTILENLSRKMN